MNLIKRIESKPLHDAIKSTPLGESHKENWKHVHTPTVIGHAHGESHKENWKLSKAKNKEGDLKRIS